jgi:hypothetical protein
VYFFRVLTHIEKYLYKILMIFLVDMMPQCKYYPVWRIQFNEKFAPEMSSSYDRILSSVKSTGKKYKILVLSTMLLFSTC